MLSYTGKRLLQTVFVLFGISLITFTLLQVVPGDPVALMLEKRADPETIARVRSELGLDLPYYVQYLNFIKGAVHLDFGTSYFTKEVVTDALFRCFKVTVKLACMSFVFASVFRAEFLQQLKEERALILLLWFFPSLVFLPRHSGLPLFSRLFLV